MMKGHKIFIFSLISIFFIAAVCLKSETLYFCYGDGEKQYFELDTRFIFISVAEEVIA